MANTVKTGLLLGALTASKAAANTLKTTPRTQSAAEAALAAARSGNTSAAQSTLNNAVGLGGQQIDTISKNPSPSPTSSRSTAQVSAAGNTYNGNTTSIPDNGVGVRSFLNTNMGIDNSRIGWDGANVTVDGSKFLSPDSVVDGTSYSGKNNLYKAVQDYYANRGDSVQAATDWAAGTGVQNAVQWIGNGQASVFGKAMTPLYLTDDGKAVFRTSDLQAAYDDWKAKTGYKTGADVFNQTQDKYGALTDKALQAVLDREAWSYDPETDAATQAYRQMYTREGNRAMEDAIAAQAAMTGGYTNSAALTAGGQAQNYYMQQYADRIPELQANSYNRYVQDAELRRADLNSVLGVSDDYYNKLYQTAAADRDAINSAFNTEYNRDITERTWQDQHAANQLSNRLTDYAVQEAAANAPYYEQNAANAARQAQINTDMAQESLTGAQIANRAAEMNLSQVQIENAFANAKTRGYFTAEEASLLGVDRSADPYAAEKAYIQWQNQTALEQYRQQSDIEWDNTKRQLDYQAAQDAEAAQRAQEYELAQIEAKNAAQSGSSGTASLSKADNEAYKVAQKRLKAKAESYGYDDPSEMAGGDLAYEILNLDTSEAVKSLLLSAYNISDETALDVYNAGIKRSDNK